MIIFHNDKYLLNSCDKLLFFSYLPQSGPTATYPQGPQPVPAYPPTMPPAQDGGLPYQPGPQPAGGPMPYPPGPPGEYGGP